MSAGIHVGDTGTVISSTILDQDGDVVDVSDADTKTIKLESPSGTVTGYDAEFGTDGTDGVITCTLEKDDIDEAGIWSVQGYVKLGAGSWNSDVQQFRVYNNLNVPAV